MMGANAHHWLVPDIEGPPLVARLGVGCGSVLSKTLVSLGKDSFNLACSRKIFAFFKALRHTFNKLISGVFLVRRS